MISSCKLCLADCAFSGKDMKKGDCKGYIPMTNADRIRAMSDEELAKFFCPETPGASPWCEPMGRVRCGKSPCWKCMLKWLRQPAGEN